MGKLIKETLSPLPLFPPFLPPTPNAHTNTQGSWRDESVRHRPGAAGGGLLAYPQGAADSAGNVPAN